jgi:hypothetical protein
MVCYVSVVVTFPLLVAYRIVADIPSVAGFPTVVGVHTVALALFLTGNTFMILFQTFFCSFFKEGLTQLL